VDANGPLRVLDVVQPALAAMLSAASSAGHVATVGSAFRAYAEQLAIFQQTTEIGRAARPGHSEHQLGTAVDLADQNGIALAWLAERCAQFGFLLSYPERLQKVTGLRYEPWHFRYVGSAMARAVLRETTTLEAYLHAHPEAAVAGDCSDCPSEISRSECGSVTPGGECRGSVLTWCFDGGLAEVDCATTGAVCGGDASGANCL
jgi:D-alanyl-D-alanine carboxypeptidase